MIKLPEHLKLIIAVLIIPTIFVLVNSILKELNLFIKIGLIFILILIIELILVYVLFKPKLKDYSKARKLKKVILTSISDIKKGETPSITLDTINFVLKHLRWFEKKIGKNELNILFEYCVNQGKLFAKNIKEEIEKSKDKEINYYEKLLKDIDNKLK